MKLGLGTGISKSPGAATMSTGPEYEYSFAMDFSKCLAADVNVGASAATSFPYVNQASNLESVLDETVLRNGGIYLELDATHSAMNSIGIPGSSSVGSADDESLIKSYFTSHSQDGFPDGSLSDVYKYLSWVVTFHSTNLADENILGFVDAGYMELEDSAGNLYGYTNFNNAPSSGDHPSYINGVDISVWNLAADLGVVSGAYTYSNGNKRRNSSGVLIHGSLDETDIPVTITWDMTRSAAYVGTPSYSAFTTAVNPAEIRYYHFAKTANRVAVRNGHALTLHGVVFSSTPPGIISLPIHTSRPVAAFA